MYRESHRVGPAEAREAIEHLGLDLALEKTQHLPASDPQPTDHHPLSGQRLAGIHAALYGGEKAKAIQLYRTLNPVEFEEAKKIIDKIEDNLRAQTPDLFTVPPTTAGRGCLVLGVCVLATLGFGGWHLLR